MKRQAIPWLTELECCGKEITDRDLKYEYLGTGKLPDKYEQEIYDFFNTDNKRTIMRKSLKSRFLPVYCSRCRRVEIVDTHTGESVRKVARIIKHLENRLGL